MDSADHRFDADYGLDADYCFEADVATSFPRSSVCALCQSMRVLL